MTSPKRVVSGMRPTGQLHLGHYHGVLANWIRLQTEFECYFFVADWHSLTTEYENPKKIRESVGSILLDWLASGIDPERATLFIQSRVPEHAELHVLLSMITPISWLERVPSYKDLKTELKDKDLSTYGFLGYPLLQTADVAIYHGELVPVGQDQVAHLELSREIVRRFNHLYGQTLAEPKPILTEAPKLLGVDGRKMSKSYQNAIALSEPILDVQKKILAMVTDPARKRRTDAGNPEVCPVFDYHKIYSPKEEQANLAAGCKSASIGCVDCKKNLLGRLVPFLEELSEKRAVYAQNPKRIEEIVEAGVAKARSVAKQTLQAVYEKMGI